MTRSAAAGRQLYRTTRGGTGRRFEWGRRPAGCGYARMASGRRGQALLIAVLLMSVILLVGILFVAVVSYNQEQAGRGVDMNAAQLLAKAGINYASSMLQNSPQGADWRPRFVAYDPSTYNANDPSTWPTPPAMYVDGTTDPNFYGPDGIPGTADDYYSDFDILRGWYPLRKGSVTNPGDFVRFGFSRYPDPNQVTPANVSADNLTMGRGYILLQVTYDPDPPYEPGDPTSQNRMSYATRIISIGRATADSEVFRRLEAYEPIGLVDHERWITDRSGGTQDGILGVQPFVDLNASGKLEAGEQLPSTFDGPVRCDSKLTWVGQNLTPSAASPTASCTFDLKTTPQPGEGYLRDDYLLAPQGLYGSDGNNSTNGAAVVVNGGTPQPLPVSLAPDASGAPSRVYVNSKDVPPLVAPNIEATDPTSGVMRYRALTRDSGDVVLANADIPEYGISSGQPVNTGLLGFGRGIYIDNSSDVQFRDNNGNSDLNLLTNDWLMKLQGRVADSGWNATYTTYTPPGVQIILFPTEAAVEASASGGISTTLPVAPGALWWPNHTPGEPGIEIIRHDHRWLRADADHVGEDSGQNVMVVDYPKFPNQVIFAEGNVRVRGVLPKARRDPATHKLLQDYNLTIVSNATIYIDGQILSPQDVDGRAVDINASSGVIDEDNSAVALLARDCVCLNPTQLVPQLTNGLVTAGADVEANPSPSAEHWELYPDSGGSVYSSWRFGWPDMNGTGTPGTAIGSGVHVNLVALEAGADPGPSGMGMVVAKSASADPLANGTVTNSSTPFTFPGGAPDPYTFLFVPPGALLPGNVPSPAPYASNAISPNWQVPGATPYSYFTSPQVPFNITGDVNKQVGMPNSIAMFHRDPRLGMGSTPYLVKRWKIEETNGTATDSSGNVYELPQGAIHAKVNAVIYAQRGCWFVIPGDYFDNQAVTVPKLDSDGPLDSLFAARFRRYNYEITVRGCITEDHTAPLDAAQTWTNHWAFPIYSGSGSNLTLDWGTIKYEFDERLRMNRDQSLTTLTGTVRQASAMVASPESSLPKLPCLPSSPTLIYGAGTP